MLTMLSVEIVGKYFIKNKELAKTKFYFTLNKSWK